MIIETVNLHVWPKCDLHCVYCYGSFPDRPASLPLARWLSIIDALADHQVRRITFSGGEPTLHPDLLAMLRRVRRHGMQTAIITNGARLVDEALAELDLVGITLDSANTHTLVALGRGDGYLVRVQDVARRTRSAGARLKVNTVVCSLNVNEDLTDAILDLHPDKWKPIQFTFVPGEHQPADRALEISACGFDAFVAHHQQVVDAGVWVAPETADLVRRTYVMIDPRGRVFQHAPEGHRISAPVDQLDLATAIAAAGGYDRSAFLARGGHVNVRHLPIISGGR